VCVRVYRVLVRQQPRTLRAHADGKIEMNKYEFVTLDKLAELSAESMVDVIGVVKEVCVVCGV